MSTGDTPIRTIVIIGGGTAGWMTAAAMSKVLEGQRPGGKPLVIRLVESEQIGTVGVGEATIPHIRFFNQKIGIDEAEIMAATQATFKLGIEFVNWGRIGDAYIHPFGDYGQEIGPVDFHHAWARLHAAGRAGRICDYSLPVVMAEQNRFGFPTSDHSEVMGTFSYAYQFDATLYARFLRRLSEARGVIRHEGRIVNVAQHSESGNVEKVILDDGREIAGDLFIDCSGFRGLLIEQTLKAGFESWADFLPCDRAIAVPCESTAPVGPYTRATAHSAGWQWRIPLQHRIGNGHVYCSDYISDDEAAATLLANLDGVPTRDLNFLRFEAGKRRKQWVKNVVSLGLASGFLEPLESTSIHLMQQGVTALLELFPARGVNDADRDEFNRVMDLEYERVRDFLILHYHATERTDSDFWNHVRTMPIPDSLAYKLRLFRERGVVVKYKDGLFLHPSWIAVYVGQRVVPQHWDPRLDALSEDDLALSLQRMKDGIAQTVAGLPTHAEVLARHCPAQAAA